MRVENMVELSSRLRMPCISREEMRESRAAFEIFNLNCPRPWAEALRKLRGRLLGTANDHGIVTRSRELLEIPRDGTALKRERHRMMDIAHQQIKGAAQPRSDKIT